MATPATFNVYSNRFEYVKGEESWRRNLRLTALAADRIRSSLGPNGAYKMVTYNRGPEKVVKITRDPVAVLEELAIEYPTLVVLSEAAKIQRQEAGDGVKTFIILTAALLKGADKLAAKGVHPTKILKGYKEAAKKAIETIESFSELLAADELDAVLEGVDCGRGCLTPEMRNMITQAKVIATRDGRLDRDRIRVLRKLGGSQLETRLIEGVVVKKGKLHPNMPDIVEAPRIALTTERVGINSLEILMPGQGPFHMKFNVTKPADMAGFRDAERQRKADALDRLKELDVNVLFCQQPIDDFSKNKLLDMGVVAFSSVDKADFALISKATGARAVGNLAELEGADVGTAQRLEMRKIGLEDITILEGCPFATFEVRGSNLQAIDELELLIMNASRLLQVAEETHKKVPGGGAVELHVAKELHNLALRFEGREQLAVDTFADAILEIPRCLALNNGVFPDDALAQLGKLHAEGSLNFGLAADGTCNEVCVEVSAMKSAAVKRAFEVASLLLRINEQVVAKEIPKFHKK